MAETKTGQASLEFARWLWNLDGPFRYDRLNLLLMLGREYVGKQGRLNTRTLDWEQNEKLIIINLINLT